MKQGPLLSKEIHEYLVSHFSITNENSRKITSNFVKSGLLFSATDLIFDSGSKLLYYKNDTTEFRKAILRYKPYLSNILNEFNKFKIISKYNLFKISAKQEDKNGKELVSLFQELSFFYCVKYYDEYIVFSSFSDDEINDAIKKYQQYEKTDLLTIASIIRNDIQCNVINNREIEYRSASKNRVNYGLYMFDAVAKGVIGNSINSDVIYLYEIATNITIDVSSINNFIYRLNNSKNVTKAICVGVLAYINISDDAIKIARFNNIRLISIKRMFGNNIESVFQTLRKNDLSIEDVEEISNLIVTSGQEDNLSNIMGELFEYIAEKIISKFYSSESIIKRRFSFDQNGRRREIDVLVRTNDEYVLIESKSSKNKVQLGSYDVATGKTTKDSVKYFYETFCLFKEKYSSPQAKFLIFAANGFRKDAVEYMNQLSKKMIPNRFDYLFVDYKIIEKIASDYKWVDLKHELYCWKQYFLKKEKKQ